MLLAHPFLLLATSTLTLASVAPSKRCTGTISSLSDVANAKKCSTININSFTVPSGETFDLTGLPANAVVNLQGDVTFGGEKAWAGPLFSIAGSSITFNGNSHTFDGNGASYWDGKGSNGGKTKPKFLKVKMSGQFKDLKVKNAPVQTFSVNGDGSKALTLSNIDIDTSAGNKLGSDGKALGHNSDCFDVSGDNITIKNSKCNNQDDCLALNEGNNFVFDSNTCIGGHGISIGSIKTGNVVKGVTISGNTVTKSTNGLRIKTYNGATSASVSDVEYIGNTVTGATDYGLVIEQDYENGSPTGTASSGVPIKNVKFSGATTSISTSGSKAKPVYVLCGTNTCTGDWDWSSLKTASTSGSSVSPSSVKNLIKNYTI